MDGTARTASTHEVLNQPAGLPDLDLVAADAALAAGLACPPLADHAGRVRRFGCEAGAAEARDLSRQANENPPKLRAFDRYGHRIDAVEFHPAYHRLMRMGLEGGVASAAWTAGTGGHALHASLLYLMTQADAGVCCPMSMSYASVAALRAEPALAAEWEPRIASGRYDPANAPAAGKAGATIGMAMTEKQGGSDVRANTTRAHPVGDDEYELVGHKWFCSAPMSDAFLTLAYAPGGLTCLLVPRWRPDGTKNAVHLMRLKDKLGDRSNASSEIEYQGAWARRVGEEGRGVRTIIDMVQGTRLDCIAGSAGGMRAALTEALWHARHRSAFQKRLIDQPAMRGVLADLCLEAEAATALMLRVARAFDAAPADGAEAAFARIATPIAKYHVCKRQPGFVYEALEAHGGAGYVEEGPMPRLFRQSPLNAIWEGSGNVIALDVLRALSRGPEALEVLRGALAAARGRDGRFDDRLAGWEGWARPGAVHEASARAFVEETALLLQAAVLADGADAVFEAFCGARLDPAGHGLGYGTARIEAAAAERLLDRAAPRPAAG
ncbi:putative acyl-CoA dehydrogenase [Hasllibacter halocynthiae]|uniref:Putative acyl-CoA dehydrogenase n=1 Tax=Hasllibacter halocynthiae TaxID=595589 RepID=A0A2T0WZC5_9RHOB|nr:acyl-CoA dehydrogenase family protein [Hasllibacter halocynthiae]PRY92040.1 putative acyl-CoA dehydrogenase [Hasllibacter halocynthiae]